MEIDTNTYVIIFVIVLVIISIISSSFMLRSSDKKQDEIKTVKAVSQNDLVGLSNIDMKLLNQTGGISGQSNSTSSGPKEFKTKSLNSAELVN